MILNDKSRGRSAFTLLGQIEVWRLEYGKPSNEPRHPAFDSGEAWPPFTRLEWTLKILRDKLIAHDPEHGSESEIRTSNDIPHDTSKTSQPIEIFYSYSHRDEDLRDELEKHLSVLKRSGVIVEWHDRRITPESEWSGEIDKHLETANIVLLLVSSDFLASDYCYEIEMKRAMERHTQRTARVIPIILRKCDWTDAPFSKLQALPKDGKPIKTWNDLDEAFTDVVAGLKRTIAGISGGP